MYAYQTGVSIALNNPSLKWVSCVGIEIVCKNINVNNYFIVLSVKSLVFLMFRLLVKISLCELNVTGCLKAQY